MKIGILDIQGSVEEHLKCLKKLKNMEAVLVKKIEDLKEVKGLIVPGGESTTIGKLLRRFGIRDEIIKRVKKGMAVWGTCAGAILLAKKIVGKENADSLGLMNIVVERNAYGRQLDSFETQVEFDTSPKKDCCGKKLKNTVRFCRIPAIFIRAPKILEVGEGVEILARYKGEIVAARENNMLVTNFHPELTDDEKVHQYFVKMCEK
ncbi:pyridoxal 5'-phosphate synthase glutaminase subunit PdxT [Candidatus Peregrinibacteria bacterium CG_4_10_14_0_2_um_filter_38_24]|nr:MAG: pyridoxal 5'-phosphate synthase glutaminase subunit PdxT [Candidatus Peregrinibacteria bacterium CG_4_10_14_0_2_um_filter_38_24]PJC38657.1 MAG: pyridoxal 5'-phosphate synthase glutaminase subunit PdxT [Candidatus Peregrinibacteria bacterium CG_4_9_14_0_2_um_filter_38_9]